MSFTLENVSAIPLAVYGLAGACVSQAFLDSSGLSDPSASGKKQSYYVSYPTHDGRKTELVHFVVMDGIPADVLLDSKWVLERGISSEMADYVRLSVTKINHDINDINDIKHDILLAVCPALPTIQLSRGADYLRAILLGHDTTGISMSVFCDKDFDVIKLLEMHGLQFESSEMYVLEERRSRLKLLKHIVTGECYSRISDDNRPACMDIVGCRVLSNGFASSHDISAYVEQLLRESNKVEMNIRKLMSLVRCLDVYGPFHYRKNLRAKLLQTFLSQLAAFHRSSSCQPICFDPYPTIFQGIEHKKKDKLMELAQSHNISFPSQRKIRRRDVIRAILEHIAFGECLQFDDKPVCQEIADSIAIDDQLSTYQVLWILRELRDVLSSHKMLMMLLDIYGVDYDERWSLTRLRSSLTKFIVSASLKEGASKPIPETY